MSLNSQTSSLPSTITKESLSDSINITEERYQALWTSYQQQYNNTSYKYRITRSLKLSAEGIEDEEQFVQYLESEKTFVKAFLNNDKVMKMYVHSLLNQQEIYFLSEIILDFNTQELTYTIKSTNPNLLQKYEVFLMNVLDPLIS